MDIFSLLLPKYTINKNKKIRLISLFSGYDSQKLAFNYLGIDVEHYRAIEFDKYAMQSLNEIHNTNFETKDITKVSADELGIVDTENITYLLTYSFPCTDLSLAGKRAGMDRESGTRSGLLWEVERLLKETKEKPQILIMENVPQVLSAKGWREWNVFLEKLGYSNYAQVLNAKCFGIPQNRERCFMVSILGEYSYEFPKSFESKDRLKDFLENNVDEKYCLSEKMISYISAPNQKWTGNNNGAFINKDVASTLNTGEGSRRCDASNYFSEDLPNNYNLQNTDKIMVVGKSKSGGERSLILDEDSICNCLLATDYKQPKQILIKEKTKKGYTETNDDYLGTYQFAKSDNFMKGKDRFIPNKEYSDTILTQCKEGIVTVGNYSPSGHNASRIGDSKGIAPTVMENHGTVTATVVKDEMPKLVGGIGEKKSNGGTQYYQQDRVYDSETVAMRHCANIPNGSYNYQLSDLRIRKLTPCECFKLMGVKPSDYNKITCSNAQKYKQAGNSIVTTCLMAIYSQLFENVDYKYYIEELLKELRTNENNI